MLSLEPLIINRILDQVPGFTTVGNASKLVGVRDIGALLPGCFVIPGGGDRSESALNIEDQEWDIIIIVPHQHEDSANGLTEEIAGAFMQGVLRALHNWQDSSASKGVFIYKGRNQPHYNMGYAEFPMTFSTKSSLGLPR